MNLTCHRAKNLSYAIIDDFFTEKELEAVTQEVKDLQRFFLPASKTRTAKESEGERLKTGKGVFLDNLYVNNRTASAILQANRKVFSPEVVEYAQNFDVIFKEISQSNSDHTLLNCYISGQEYRPHADTSRLSVVTFLREGDFSGGEFFFPEQEEVIPCIHNRAVLFPGCVTHAALPIKGQGRRISLAHFINLKGDDRH